MARLLGFFFLPDASMFIMLLIYVPDQISKPPARSVVVKLPSKLDLECFALFAGACIMFLTGINWGGTTYPWDSAKVIGLLYGSGGTLALFMTWSMYRRDDALIPPRFLGERNLFIGCWISGLQGAATIMVGYYLPLWFQTIRGASPTNSGLMLLPTMIGQIVGSLISGSPGKVQKITSPAGEVDPNFSCSPQVPLRSTVGNHQQCVDSNQIRPYYHIHPRYQPGKVDWVSGHCGVQVRCSIEHGKCLGILSSERSITIRRDVNT